MLLGHLNIHDHWPGQVTPDNEQWAEQYLGILKIKGTNLKVFFKEENYLYNFLELFAVCAQ